MKKKLHTFRHHKLITCFPQQKSLSDNTNHIHDEKHGPEKSLQGYK